MPNVLVSRPRRTIGTLALVLAASGVAIGSGASFTSSSATGISTFTAGTLTQSNDKAGVAILSATNMKPGDTTTGTVKITNTGSLASTFTAVASDVASTFSKTTLNLKVTEGPTEVYNGKFNGFGSKDLGLYAAGASHTYTFTVSFPTVDDAGSADQNVDQGKTASARFSFNATQTAGRDLTTTNTNGTN